MPSRETGVPIPVLREALRQRVKESSLRAAAKEVGMSYKGVDNFLAGATDPYPSTVRKLTEWYLRRAAASEEEPAAETVAAALELIVRHFPPAHREEVIEELVATVRSVGVRTNVPAPRWMG